MTQDLERNKRAAMASYDLMVNQSRPRESIEKYLGDVYIQHNPRVADGKDAFVELLRENGPGVRRQAHFKRVIAEGQRRDCHTRCASP